MVPFGAQVPGIRRTRPHIGGISPLWNNEAHWRPGQLLGDSRHKIEKGSGLTAHAHQPHSTVLLGGQHIDAVAIRHLAMKYQADLKEVRAEYGHALCACVDPPLKLVIRERSGKFHLAAWPDQAQRHAFACPFHSETEHSGRKNYEVGTVAEADGVVRLKLALRFVYRKTEQSDMPALASAIISPPAAPDCTQPARQERRDLRLKGLLHYLWEEAAINRWNPGWKRDWGFVRYRLRKVLEATYVGDTALLTRTYIPRLWTEQNRAENQAAWKAFIEPLLAHHRKAEVVHSGLVLAMVRDLQPTRFGKALFLANHSKPFYVDERMERHLQTFHRRGWEAIEMMAKERATNTQTKSPTRPTHVAVLARVQSSSTGRIVIADACLMRVTADFIPVDSEAESRMALELVRSNRAFVKPLAYDARGPGLPSFVLNDLALGANQAIKRLAIYIYSAELGEIVKIRTIIARDAQARGTDTSNLHWDQRLTPALPPLPSARTSVARTRTPELAIGSSSH